MANMRLHKLEENSDFQVDAMKYRVTSCSPPLITAIRSGNDIEEEFNFFELINNPTFMSLNVVIRKSVNEEKKKKHVSVLDTLNKKQRAVVSARFELIQPILLHERAKQGDLRAETLFLEKFKAYLQKKESVTGITQDTVIKRTAAVFNVSTRTIKRRLAEYRSAETSLPNQGLTALVPKVVKHNYLRKDCKVLEICHPKKPDLILDTVIVRLKDEALSIVKGVIEQEYLALIRPSTKAICDSIEAKCLLNDIIPPSYDTVSKILKRLNPELKERMRNGKSGDEKYTEVQRGFSNKEAKFPLHIVEIDHTQLDIDVIDEKTGYVIGRPYITLGIDVFSRQVWCMEVSFDPPSAEKVRRALMHGLFYKEAKQKYGTHNEWDIYGIPTIIYLDNGPEFKNADVRRMINETLESQVQFRPVKTPRYGGTIERLFGTINSELIHRLAGTRKGSVSELGDYDAEKEAVFTLEDIRELLTIYITDIYHHSVHKGLPIEFPTPATRYYAGLGMTGFPDWIDKEEEEHYRMELLPVLMKPYTRDGVRFSNIIYRAENHKNLIRPREYKYKIKFDSNDVSKLYLQLPSTGEYLTLLSDSSLREELVGMNRFTFNKIMSILKEKGEINSNQVLGTRHVRIGLTHLLQKIQEKIKTRRKAREQAARMRLEMQVTVSQPPKSENAKSDVTLLELFEQFK